jgi:hypothetical protein
MSGTRSVQLTICTALANLDSTIDVVANLEYLISLMLLERWLWGAMANEVCVGIILLVLASVGSKQKI